MQLNEANAIAKTLITIPAEFEAASVHHVTHDGEPIVLVRYKKKNQVNQYGGEHFSLTFTEKTKTLKGFMHLEEQFDTDVVPDEETAQKIAFEFLKKHAADIVDSVEVRWIRPLNKKPVSSPHDDPFFLNSGTAIIGMRVKLLIQSNNKYGWVIVGKNGHIITFERDICWDTVKKCRATERWLHDNWVVEQPAIV